MQISGFSLCSFFTAFIVYPLLPEVQCISHVKEGLLNDVALVDKASGIYSLFFALGCIIAVLIGKTLDNKADFPITCDVIGFISIGFAIIFFVTNRVYEVICKKPERDEDPIMK
jgi:hypothetical protein